MQCKGSVLRHIFHLLVYKIKPVPVYYMTAGVCPVAFLNPKTHSDSFRAASFPVGVSIHFNLLYLLKNVVDVHPFNMFKLS